MGRKPIHLYCYKNSHTVEMFGYVISKFVERGVSIHERDKREIVPLVYVSDVNVVDLCAKIDCMVLKGACLECVCHNDMLVIEYFCRMDNPLVIQHLKRYTSKTSRLLLMSARYGSDALLRWLCITEDINACCATFEGYTPLIAALEARAPIETLTLMVELGANVNKKSSKGSYKEMSPLKHALRSYEYAAPIVELLVKKGASSRNDVYDCTPTLYSYINSAECTQLKDKVECKALLARRNTC